MLAIEKLVMLDESTEENTIALVLPDNYNIINNIIMLPAENALELAANILIQLTLGKAKDV